MCAYDAQAVFVCFSQAHISIPSSTPNHPQPRLSIRYIRISGTGPNGACTRLTHIYRREPPAYPITTSTPGLNAEPPTAPLVLPLCTCSGYRPVSGPVPGNAKSAILCHEYHGAPTLILTGYLPSCPDIPEAQDDCLRVLFPDDHAFPQRVSSSPCTRIRD